MRISGIPGTPGALDHAAASRKSRRRKSLFGMSTRHLLLWATRLFRRSTSTRTAPLRKYIAARQKDLSSETGPERARNRYAVGVGVGLILLDETTKKLAEARKPVDDDLLLSAKRAAAQAALSVLPEFDLLAREAGVEQ